MIAPLEHSTGKLAIWLILATLAGSARLVLTQLRRWPNPRNDRAPARRTLELW